MALPADWTQNDQHRALEMDAELTGSSENAFRSVQRMRLAKQRFVALNLGARWPTLVTEYVHNDPSASTRQEQTDLSNLIEHMEIVLLGKTGVSPLTNAQAATIFNRYAK